MSKTVEVQIEKSRNLINGLKKHLKESGDRSITIKELDATESSLKELKNLSNEIDRLRERLNPLVKEVNRRLTEVKKVYAEQKKIIKGRYQMERWADYGVPDKKR